MRKSFSIIVLCLMVALPTRGAESSGEFFDGKSLWGWVLTLGGALMILLGILMNLRIYFEATSLFNTLVMLVLLFGGLGLLARSLKPSA